MPGRRRAPPEREEEREGGDGDSRERCADAAGGEDSFHAGRCDEHAFSEEDDREQAVALGDVMGCQLERPVRPDHSGTPSSRITSAA